MNKELRVKKHIKVRKKIIGTKNRPRLSVFRSNQHIYAQIIDDALGKTIVSAIDYEESGTKTEKAYKIGKKLAGLAIKRKITTIVFDRGGFLYKGRVEKLAQGAREGGLKF